MPKFFNPLFTNGDDEVQPIFAAINPSLEEEVTANEIIDIVCGPIGIDIPAQVQPITRTVTPILK